MMNSCSFNVREKAWHSIGLHECQDAHSLFLVRVWTGLVVACCVVCRPGLQQDATSISVQWSMTTKIPQRQRSRPAAGFKAPVIRDDVVLEIVRRFVNILWGKDDSCILDDEGRRRRRDTRLRYCDHAVGFNFSSLITICYGKIRNSRLESFQYEAWIGRSFVAVEFSSSSTYK